MTDSPIPSICYTSPICTPTTSTLLYTQEPNAEIEMTSTEPTYTDFFELCPRKCLRCHNEGVTFEHALIQKWRPSVGHSVMCDIVICHDKKCKAVHAVIPEKVQLDDGRPYRYDNRDVTFVDRLPYHISLGGKRMSSSLSSLPHSLVQRFRPVAEAARP